MRNIEFVSKAFEEYRQWIDKDRKLHCVLEI